MQCTYLGIPTWLQIAPKGLGLYSNASTFMSKTALSLSQQSVAFKKPSPVLLWHSPWFSTARCYPPHFATAKVWKSELELIEKTLKTS